MRHIISRFIVERMMRFYEFHQDPWDLDNNKDYKKLMAWKRKLEA